VEVFVVGTSHSIAPVAVRERLHVNLDEIYEAVGRLMGPPGLLEEAVPLATCGRLELYGVSQDPERASRLLLRLLSRRVGVATSDVRGRFYTLRGAMATRHLLRVAAGLDSVVHGEEQILGQVREASRHRLSTDTKGRILHRLFDVSLATGKRVRHETNIGRGAASLASAALGTVKREMGPLSSASALVLGAGETGALVARLLSKAGVGRLVIANRTLETAREVATSVGGEGVGLEGLVGLMADADLIVGAVTAEDVLVTPETMSAMGERAAAKPRYFLDLAHPRNFDPALADVAGVTLVDLEQVFQRVEEARSARAEQVPQAEAIVNEQTELFEHWLRSRQSVPVLRAIREQVLDLAREEAERFGQGRSAEEREQLFRFARSLARTLLHAPTVALRAADPESPEGRLLLEQTPTLFGVGTESAERERPGRTYRVIGASAP